jgi:hypothetical protein
MNAVITVSTVNAEPKPRYIIHYGGVSAMVSKKITGELLTATSWSWENACTSNLQICEHGLSHMNNVQDSSTYTLTLNTDKLC